MGAIKARLTWSPRGAPGYIQRGLARQAIRRPVPSHGRNGYSASDFKRAFAHRRGMASVEEVKRRHEARLMKTPGVVGVGIGRSGKRTVIRVYVEKDSPKVRKAVPEALEDVPVEIVVSGPFKAL